MARVWSFPTSTGALLEPRLDRTRVLLVGIAVAGLLTGCSQGAKSDSVVTNENGSNIATPGWADEISAYSGEATTELERQILSDGKITAEELAAAQDAFVSCTRLAGFTVSSFTNDGGYSIDGPFTDDGPPALAKCEKSFNHTAGMYWMMLRNPAGIDEAELMVNCLKRAGVVDASMSRAEYLDRLGTSPLTVSDPAFSKCNANPTTAFK